MKVILATLGTTIMLTACSGPTVATPTVTITASQTAPIPTPTDNESPQAGANDNFSSNDDATYLTLLRGSDSAFYVVDDQTLIDLGKTTCEAFDAGMTLEMYASVATNSGVTTDQAATIAAAAIVIYCPWHEGIAG